MTKSLNDQIPKSLNHIAIIMDGNGRWANARGLPRTAGHKKGVDATKAIVRHAGKIGLNHLTLYAFSTENWSRPDDEINDLMGLLRFYMKGEAAELYKNNVRLSIIGFRDRLSNDIIKLIEDIEDKSKDNTGLHLTIALDYGARQEILNAVNSAIASGSKEISKDEFEALLFTNTTPDPDLIIRTSGETRISNFLLWQAAYSEFIFTDILWPDFTTVHFDNAINEYQNRDRRYGGIGKAHKI
jgi:undecaprenyl diphosphate synthase